MKKIKLKKLAKFSFATMMGLFLAGSGVAVAFECKEKRTSMAKPSGFPSRALTMVVPYGPGGG
ncbi:MAG: tripartite tricarboxylate transporter substrate binding protein, partial [SAR324 cluster bacterium]|nr:tripartite tricarboxylate transporter substrate binding protein [SAR324 cluster bacterium]